MKLALAATAVVTLAAVAAAPTASASDSASSPAPLSSVSHVATSDFELDFAVAGTPPTFTSDECVTYGAAKACFQKYGDKIWVSGNSSAPWQNFLRNSSGSWDNSSYREGSCQNNLGAGHWGVCNKDFYEWSTLNGHGGYGSGLRLAVCTPNCSGQIWVQNDG